jgi:hypothetical protein
LAGFVAGAIVAAAIVGATACTAITFGVCGAVILGSAIAAGAVSGGITYALQPGPKSLSGFGQAVGFGAIGGLFGGVLGAIVGKVIAAVAPKLLAAASGIVSRLSGSVADSDLAPAAAKVPDSRVDSLPNSKGVGTKWEDPGNRGNRIRVDAAVPDSPYPSQQANHVVIHSGGRILGPDGEPVIAPRPSKTEDADIPVSDWLNWQEWNQP